MKDITFAPIGHIRSPFTDPKGMPIQPAGAWEVTGEVLVLDEFTDGLKDLEGFSHLILLYHFHQSRGYDLHVTPFMDNAKRGLFSTRAPRRPNMIGLSIVKLDRIEGSKLFISGVDVLDNTPLLDIKPYVAKFDSHPECQNGWLEDNAQKADKMRSDSRFDSSTKKNS